MLHVQGRLSFSLLIDAAGYKQNAALYSPALYRIGTKCMPRSFWWVVCTATKQQNRAFRKLTQVNYFSFSRGSFLSTIRPEALITALQIRSAE